MAHIDCYWRTTARLALVTMSVLAASSHAAGSSWLEPAPMITAQTTTAPSADKIRAQSQRMKEYRALLADPDSNVRLAALDEMLKSSEPALRELAFEAGFASADQNMRALTLRARIFSMKSFILEPQNVPKMEDKEWKALLTRVGANPRFTFTITKVDPQTGNIDLEHCPGGRVAGQEFSFSCGRLAVRLRLTDGAVMTGTVSGWDRAVAVTLTLQ